MLSRMYNFSKRHRYKFVATSAVIGGVALLGKLAEAKLRSLREEETRRLLEATMRGHQGGMPISVFLLFEFRCLLAIRNLMHTMCVVHSVMILCQEILPCSTGQCADAAATVQPNWQPELHIQYKTKLHD